jgi:hypothetical protein
MESANGDIPRGYLECQKAPPGMPWNGKNDTDSGATA